MRPHLTAVAFLFLLPLVGCSVENGGKLFQPTPSGTIELRLVGGKNVVIKSSKQQPVKVHSNFSLWVNEANYTDYFTASVVSWTGGTLDPCFVVPTTPNNTILTFTPSADPGCYPGNGDIEGIRVSDEFGNQTVQYFKDVRK